MSSGLLESLRRNIGLRLSLLYALIFTVSSVALLALAYYLLAAAVGSKDREVLEARLKEAAVVYEAGGVSGAARLGAQPARLRCRTPCSSTWSTRLNGADLRHQRAGGLGGVPGCARLGRLPPGALSSASRKNAERDYTLGQRRLCPDGWVLQIGRTTNSREAVLNPIRRSFLLVGSVTIVLGFLAGAFFAHRAMRPVRQIVATARSHHPHRPA